MSTLVRTMALAALGLEGSPLTTVLLIEDLAQRRTSEARPINETIPETEPK